jgi:GTP-binding protein EngB required for normal cell division
MSDTDVDSSFESTGVGLSSSALSQGRRHLLDIVNRLHTTGVQVDMDLPQIAVVGQQSAGKSSLIESISGITLPRASGTCTRCPTECKLTRTKKPWQCVVSLRFITDTTGQPLGQPRIDRFGETIFDSSLVEERVRRGQRAILNPTITSKTFLTGDDDDFFDDATLTFSTNSVILEISGPEVEDLAFCDLPGIIATASSTSKSSDIELIRGLVTSYIKKPSCLILLTVACETDFENQGAHELAKKYDPQGIRTVGVLTKPDRISAGDEENWLSFIRNEREPLTNNWFCVKQPSSASLKLGITWKEARAQEDEFFSMTTPWSEMDTTYQKYLRTRNLVERLSIILSDLIAKRLPEIQEELQTMLQNTEDQIHSLPKPPSSDPFVEINGMLYNFSSDLHLQMLGIANKEGLLQRVHPAHEDFRSTIRGTAPDFRPYERRERRSKTFTKPEFLANEEDDDDGELKEDQDSNDGNDLAASGPIYIDEVLNRAKIARTRELPGNYPFVVKQNFISEYTKLWERPAKSLCSQIYALVIGQVKYTIQKHFSAYGQGILEQRLKVILTDYIKQCYDSAQQKIAWLISLEQKPFTLNTHYLADYKHKFASFYKGHREKESGPSLMAAINRSPVLGPVDVFDEPHGISKIMQGLAEVGIHGVKPADLPKILPPDAFEPALDIMADVRAYFQVSYKRFSDNIPLAIDSELVLAVGGESLMSTIFAGLGLGGSKSHQICRDLAQEHPSTASRREELMKKLDRLTSASQELLSIRA